MSLRVSVEGHHSTEKTVASASSTSSASSGSPKPRAGRKGAAKLRVSTTSFVPPKPNVDPFASRTKPLTVYDGFKIFVLGLILLPLRWLLIAIFLLIANLWAFIFSIGAEVDLKHPEKLAPWRVAIVLPVLSAIARSILFVMGFYWINVKGKPADSDKAPIIVSNHIGYFEPFYYITAGYAHVAKFEAVNKWFWRVPCVFLQVQPDLSVSMSLSLSPCRLPYAQVDACSTARRALVHRGHQDCHRSSVRTHLSCSIPIYPSNHAYVALRSASTTRQRVESHAPNHLSYIPRAQHLLATALCASRQAPSPQDAPYNVCAI